MCCLNIFKHRTCSISNNGRLRWKLLNIQIGSSSNLLIIILLVVHNRNLFIIHSWIKKIWTVLLAVVIYYTFWPFSPHNLTALIGYTCINLSRITKSKFKKKKCVKIYQYFDFLWHLNHAITNWPCNWLPLFWPSYHLTGYLSFLTTELCLGAWHGGGRAMMLCSGVNVRR